MFPDADSEFLRPAPAGVDDGQVTWLDGWCWFFCGHLFTQVVWVGVVSAVGVQAPLYACEPCLTRLHHAAWDYAEAVTDLPVDETGLPVPLYPTAGAERPHVLRFRRGRHRRPRTPLGARFHRAITQTETPGASRP